MTKMLVQVQTLDLYEQKRLKMLAWVQEMDLCKHYFSANVFVLPR